MNNPPVRPKENFLLLGKPHIARVEMDEVVGSLYKGWLSRIPGSSV